MLLYGNDILNLNEFDKKQIKEASVEDQKMLNGRFLMYLVTEKPKYSENGLNNAIDFLTMIHEDAKWKFVEIAEYLDIHNEGFKYLAKMHSKMQEMSKKYYDDFYKKMIEKAVKLNNEGKIKVRTGKDIL